MTADVVPVRARTVHGASTSAHSDSLRLTYSQVQPEIYKQVHDAASIISMGSEVARILKNGWSRGRVIAVFSRSLYVQCDDDVFCIGVASLRRGPLHVLLDSNKDRLPWQIPCGLTVSPVCDTRIGWGSGSALPASDKPYTHGHHYFGLVSSDKSAPEALHNIRPMLELIKPSIHQGFAWIVASADWLDVPASLHFSPDSHNTIDQCLYSRSIAALKCLYGWLVKSLNLTVQVHPGESGRGMWEKPVKIQSGVVKKIEVPVQLIDLLGAGPGLTPAGDDLLAGVMLALHRIHCADLAVSLWQVLEPQLVTRTNMISAAHLRLASQGRCSEQMMQLLEGVLDATGSEGNSHALQAIAVNVQALADSMGASSGWDTLAGISLVLRNPD